MDIGEKIRYYREKRGYSQKELAEKVHMSIRTIGHYETGTRTPHIKLLTPLAKALSISVSDFFKEEEKQTHKKEETYTYFEHVWLCQYDKAKHTFCLQNDSFIKDEIEKTSSQCFVRTTRKKDMILFNCKNVERIVETETFFEKNIPYISIEEEEVLPLLHNECSPTNYYVIMTSRDTKHLSKIAVAVDSVCEVVDMPLTCQQWNDSMNRLKEREELLTNLSYVSLHIHLKAQKIHGENSGPLHEYSVFIKGIASALENRTSLSFKKTLEQGLQQVYLSLDYTIKEQYNELVREEQKMYPEPYGVFPSWMYSLEGVYQKTNELLIEESQ